MTKSRGKSLLDMEIEAMEKRVKTITEKRRDRVRETLKNYKPQKKVITPIFDSSKSRYKGFKTSHKSNQEINEKRQKRAKNNKSTAFSRSLNWYMLDHKLTEHDLAAALGVTIVTIKKWTRSKCRISPAKLKKLNEYAGFEIVNYEIERQSKNDR